MMRILLSTPVLRGKSFMSFFYCRCHRIGQTRDVHIYRLVCAHTIEENIWRKQLQKRLLDEIVVDQGSFTATNAARKLGRLEVEGQKGSDLQETEWYSNANMVKELLTVSSRYCCCVVAALTPTGAGPGVFSIISCKRSSLPQ